MSFKVALTGTGTPRPRAGRAGSGTLVQADTQLVQIDAGRATTLRLAELGVKASDLAAVFLTHHHSDHLMATADVVITRWIEGGAVPIEFVAPDGPLTRFGENFLAPWQDDVEVRMKLTGRARPTYDWRTFEASATPEVVWRGTDELQVESVRVRHEPVVPAVAYRVSWAGMSVVVSGDTRVCAEVEDLARDCSVLVHEVIRPRLSRAESRPQIVSYHSEPAELGALAARAGVGTLILTHLEPPPQSEDEEAELVAAVREGGFEGQLIVGRDLMVYDVESATLDRSACPPISPAITLVEVSS